MKATRSHTRWTSGSTWEREEDGLASVTGLVDEVVELVLHERVEARGGLIEDEQLGPVHERLDEAELALVAGGEVGHLALQVAVQPLGELVDVGQSTPPRRLAR